MRLNRLISSLLAAALLAGLLVCAPASAAGSAAFTDITDPAVAEAAADQIFPGQDRARREVMRRRRGRSLPVSAERADLRLPLLPHTSQTNRVLAHQQNTAFCSFSPAPAREAARFSRP